MTIVGRLFLSLSLFIIFSLALSLPSSDLVTSASAGAETYIDVVSNADQDAGHGDLLRLASASGTVQVRAPCSAASGDAEAPALSLHVNGLDVLQALAGLVSVTKDVYAWTTQHSDDLWPGNVHISVKLAAVGSVAAALDPASTVPSCTLQENSTEPGKHSSFPASLEVDDGGTLLLCTAKHVHVHLADDGALIVGDMDVLHTLANASATLSALREGIRNLPEFVSGTFPAHATSTPLFTSSAEQPLDQRSTGTSNSPGIAVDTGSGDLHLTSNSSLRVLHASSSPGAHARLVVGEVDVGAMLANVTAVIEAMGPPLVAFLHSASLTLDCQDAASRSAVARGDVTQVGAVDNCCCPEVPMLTRVLGDVGATTSETTLAFGSITEVWGDVRAAYGLLSSVDFGSLLSIRGQLDLQAGHLDTVVFDPLQVVGGDVHLANNPLEGFISFRTLRAIGGRLSFYNNNLYELDLGSLESVGDHLSLHIMPSLKDVRFGQLTAVGGALRVHECPSLSELFLDPIESVGSDANFDSNIELANVDLGRLRRIGGDLDLRHTQVNTINLDFLQELGGLLWIEYHKYTGLLPFTKLREAGGGLGLCCADASVASFNLSSLAHLFVNGMGFDSFEGLTALRLGSAFDRINGSMVITSNSVLGTLDLGTLAHIDGELTVFSNAGLSSVRAPALTSVAGDVGVINNSMRQFSLPQLQRHSGTISISRNQHLANIRLPALRMLGGALSLQNNALTGFDFGPLHRVGRDVRLSHNRLESVRFRALTAVGGSLDLSANPLQHIDFANLTSVGSYTSMSDCDLRDIDFGVLTTVQGRLSVRDNANLTGVQCPVGFSAECIMASADTTLSGCPPPC